MLCSLSFRHLDTYISQTVGAQGVLSPALFANGHTFFVQQVQRHGRQPYSVHLTYQYGDHARFAFGKRQRLRQAGLWATEEPEYYEGKFVALADEGAMFPPLDVGNGPQDWREVRPDAKL